MATSVKLTQLRRLVTIPPDPPEYDYKLQVEFTEASVGFQNELILIKKGATEADDTYEHICTVGDINHYRTSRSEDPSHLYYRTASWDLFYTSLEELEDEVLVQQQKAQYVVTDWETYTGGTINQDYEHVFTAS